MRRLKRYLTEGAIGTILVVLIAAMDVAPTSAIPIYPGDTKTLSGAPDPFSGLTPASTFTGGGTLLVEAFLLASGAGFRYSLSGSDSSTPLALIAGAFGQWITDVNFIKPAGLLPPPMSGLRLPGGDWLLLWGATGAAQFYVLTDAPGFDLGGSIFAFTGGPPVSIPGAPQPVPEPASLLLMGSGLVGLGILARKRKDVFARFIGRRAA